MNETVAPQGKTALVLAGGGLTGAVYEIGALRAINDLLVDRTVNDFDIFVGTSAGALIATMLANGISPEVMAEVVAGNHPNLPPLSRDIVLNPSPRDVARIGMRLPGAVFRALRHYARHLDDVTLFDLLYSLSDSLPAGLYDNRALEQYVAGVLEDHACCNDLREIDRDLNLIATDLDSGERVIFGRHDNGHVPISKAVAASAALPVLFKPVRIDGREYVDGGLRGNASLDVAIEHGATLIVCINPLVPVDNREAARSPFFEKEGRHLSEKGFTAIANQVGRINAHAGLHYHVKQLRRSHPRVDIILIEPRPDDYEMFFYNIMRYSTRLIVGRHGFETVSVHMAERYEHYQEVLARHGIDISRSLVRQELVEIQDSNYAPETIRRILEARPGSGGHRPNRAARRLGRTLRDLEQALDQL